MACCTSGGRATDEGHRAPRERLGQVGIEDGCGDSQAPGGDLLHGATTSRDAAATPREQPRIVARGQQFASRAPRRVRSDIRAWVARRAPVPGDQDRPSRVLRQPPMTSARPYQGGSLGLASLVFEGRLRGVREVVRLGGGCGGFRIGLRVAPATENSNQEETNQEKCNRFSHRRVPRNRPDRPESRGFPVRTPSEGTRQNDEKRAGTGLAGARAGVLSPRASGGRRRPGQRG